MEDNVWHWAEKNENLSFGIDGEQLVAKDLVMRLRAQFICNLHIW